MTNVWLKYLSYNHMSAYSLQKNTRVKYLSHFCLGDTCRVEDAVIRYLNRKPVAGNDAPGST